ncbi:MAG: amino acid carrier protein [Planctomycetota bacterium]
MQNWLASLGDYLAGVLEDLESLVGIAVGILFGEHVVFILLGVGVLFTIWSGFGQWRALTHGVAVIRGKYDNPDEPGAINHFQALSAALSATVGLGNIGGVAVAIAIGGPGAVFWMWVIGLLGMALKMTEVTQAMLYRNTDDPKNPHGGPMFVVEGLLRSQGGRLGVTIGGIFSFAVLLAAITGGNMFQAWNVAEVTTQYFDVPYVNSIDLGAQLDWINPEKTAVGVVLMVIVGAVILGGIRRIGAVAGAIVPFMCLLYLAVGLVVLVLNITAIPGMILDIILGALPEQIGGRPSEPGGAFIGGTVGMAMIWGVKRALFSSEAGWGSAPMAHAAARTDEPVREGVVAGLEPFIDTIVVCTVTALVILSTGAWNRGPTTELPEDTTILVERDGDAWQISTPPLPPRFEEIRKIRGTEDGDSGWTVNDSVFLLVDAHEDPEHPFSRHRVFGSVSEITPEGALVSWEEFPSRPMLDEGGTPVRDEDGRIVYQGVTLAERGVYANYPGASLTAHAFDRAIPGLGLGKILVVLASWLFAVSTMISWSYYGEQAVYYFLGTKHIGKVGLFVFRLVYSMLAAVSCIGFITTDRELDMWTTLGMGAMIAINVPIMVIFGHKAMKAYHGYFRRYKAGEMDAEAQRTETTTED